MTELLEKALAEMRLLPDEQQDAAAEILLAIAAQDPNEVRLTPDQAAEIRRRLTGEPDYASEADVSATLERLSR